MAMLLEVTVMLLGKEISEGGAAKGSIGVYIDGGGAAGVCGK